MTASVVNGLRVVTEGPTLAPITTRDGKAIWWEQTRTLHLEDGSTVYGCLHCDHTTTNVGGIRPHLRVHADPDKPRAPRKKIGDQTLNGVLRRLEKLAKVEQERDKWKERALEAERTISSWRQAMHRLGIAAPDGE